MKLLIFIFVLPHADAASLSPAPGDITIEGSTQSDRSGLAKRPGVADTVREPVAKIPLMDGGIDVAPPVEADDSGIPREDISDSTSEKPALLPADPDAVAPPGEVDDSGIPPEDIYDSTSEYPAFLPADPEQSDSFYNIAEPGIAPVGDRYPSSHAQPESSFGKAGTAAVYGESHPSVIVTTEARHNAFLAGISSLFAASFAGPVVDPSMTRQIELEPRGTPLDDATLGMGETKTGKFYVLKGTDEEVVIKWFKMHELRKTENLGLVLADFHSQSIAHLLSQVYSERVRDAEKVYYMQPLLVTSRADDGVVHYGLMERKFGSFDKEVPSTALLDRHLDFQNLLNSETDFVNFRDVQGWYQSDEGLFMTDAMLEIFDGEGDAEVIEEDSGNKLRMMYDSLERRVVVMKNENMDSIDIDEESFFGRSVEDDKVTIREIQDVLNTQCLRVG
eukprot:GEMP01040863.1.p1 GENE.GEMP01040863.1~~GEMP01040863.1.p1  ORF type:complete len:448 (+),score=74.11 GEMP01040863.1:131-1474(+)